MQPHNIFMNYLIKTQQELENFVKSRRIKTGLITLKDIILMNNKVPIYIQGDTSYTDFSKINLGVPREFLNQDRTKVLLAIEGELIHECYHILETDGKSYHNFIKDNLDFTSKFYEISENLAYRILLNLCNILEDGRIERIASSQSNFNAKRIAFLNLLLLNNIEIDGANPFNDILSVILSLSVLGVAPEKTLHVYKNSGVDIKYLETLKMFVKSARYSKTFYDMSSYIYEILKLIKPFVENTSDIDISNLNIVEMIDESNKAPSGLKPPSYELLFSEESKSSKNNVEEKSNSEILSLFDFLDNNTIVEESDNAKNTNDTGASKDTCNNSSLNALEEAKDTEDTFDINTSENCDTSDSDSSKIDDNENYDINDSDNSKIDDNENCDTSDSDNSKIDDDKNFDIGDSDNSKIDDENTIFNPSSFNIDNLTSGVVGDIEEIIEEILSDYLIDFFVENEIDIEECNEEKETEDFRRSIEEKSEVFDVEDIFDSDNLLKDSWKNFKLNIIPRVPILEETPNDVIYDTEYIKDSFIEVFQYKNRRRLNLRNGNINSSSLWRYCTGDDKIFSRNLNNDNAENVLYILIDNSGSMRGQKYIDAMYSASMIEECLKELIPIKIVTFNNDFDNITHKIVKDYNDIESGSYSYTYYKNNYPGSANADGISLRIAARDLNERNELNKIFIVISDGLPSGGYGYSGKLAQQDVANAVNEIRESGISLYSIFINSDRLSGGFDTFKKMYQYNTLECKSSELLDELLELLKIELC